MNRFTSSPVFALTILTGTANFAQSPLPAESNTTVPASTTTDSAGGQI